MAQQPRTGSQQVFRQALQLSGAGRLAEAKALLASATGGPNASTEELQLLGVICSELGQHEEALRHLRRAIQVAPKSVSAHFNLGNALLKNARYEEALASFTEALALKPNTAPFLAASGDALSKLGRYDEAIARYQRAAAAAPDEPHAHENLGRVFYKLDRTKEAVKSLQQAIRLVPDNSEAIFLLGKCLLSLELMAPAIEAFNDVLKRLPDHTGALGGLIHGKQHLCEWSDYQRLRETFFHDIERRKVAANPFVALLVSDDPALHLAAASRATAYERAQAPVRLPARPRTREKLRLGYVSADFRQHPSSVLSGSLFAQHDRRKFELFGFSLGEDDGSALRKRILSGFDHFFDVKDNSAEAISERMRALEIDIAIDLMGHTNDARREIFQHRAAPIQVNFLGYPGTTGADYMDYIILDPFIATEWVRANLAEKPVILPDCYQVNDRQRPLPESAPGRAECGLPATGFVFCAFNNPTKITPEIFDVWMRILKAVDGSVLWLVSGSRAVAGNLRKEAEARGVAPERLVIGGPVELEQHLARYRTAGLLLDTLPYGGHTTTSDALWMGCPVLTCVGESFAARVAGSILHTIGLPELITHNLADYEALAITLAGDPERLAAMRAKIAAARLTTPLFDTPRFTGNIERAYLEMWRLHQSGEAPREIAISAHGTGATES